MSTENAQPTALETYRARRAEVARLMEVLTTTLEGFTQNAEANPGDWGYAGTMSNIRERLVEMLGGFRELSDGPHCPHCFETELDNLIWRDDETVDCQTCGHAFQP
jgi:hypothetical protein